MYSIICVGIGAIRLHARHKHSYSDFYLWIYVFIYDYQFSNLSVFKSLFLLFARLLSCILPMYLGCAFTLFNEIAVK
jgi:hypothetical protein